MRVPRRREMSADKSILEGVPLRCLAQDLASKFHTSPVVKANAEVEPVMGVDLFSCGFARCAAKQQQRRRCDAAGLQ